MIGSSDNNGVELPVWSVSQLNQRARQLLEGQLARVAVVGEVSNVRVVGGHAYFSLKDDRAQVAAVLFSREVELLGFDLVAGLKVLATGRVTVFQPRGTFQIVLDTLEVCGTGALQTAFEELKRKLDAEGLFATSRKRPLPPLPRRVGVITSPTGAVIRDIVQVATRRFPGARMLVLPVRVQGAEAAPMIARAIGKASHWSKELGLDVLIVARGGGSIEDLWAFNDEKVARAIAASQIPVVSAVGHETDFTIADFVADVRAPTPSVAAELVFPEQAELVARLRRLAVRIERSVGRDIQRDRHRLRAAGNALGDGRALIAVQSQRLDFAIEALRRSAQTTTAARRLKLEKIGTRLAHLHPRVRLGQLRGCIQALGERVELLAVKQIEWRRHCLAGVAGRLKALSPLGVLERGYSIVLGPDGKALCETAGVRAGDRLDIRLARGRLGAVVDGIETEE